VAPEHCTNKVFSKILAEVFKKPFFFPNIPSFILKLILGEMSDVILKGSRVSSEKITQAGYEFIYPRLKVALEDVLDVKQK
jgi:NAD dependent epimerase/dehydratase family enzyme